MNAPFNPLRGEFLPQSTVARYLCELFASHGTDKEHFYAIFLDADRKYLGDRFLQGERIAAVQLRARQILAEGLKLEARGLVIAHNHPSGVCLPSAGDLKATRKLFEIALALDIELLDHLIITGKSAYSIRAGSEV